MTPVPRLLANRRLTARKPLYPVQEITMALEKELATYRDKLPELIQHEGKFVLIHGDSVIDYFGAYEDAIKAGYQRFQLEPFLVKQVNAVEQIQHMTRRLLPFKKAS
jgi:hypothetical protein